MRNQTIDVNPNIDELFDGESMYALVNLGFNYKDYDMEYRLIRGQVVEDIRQVILGIDDKQDKKWLIPLTNEKDIEGLSRLCNTFSVAWIYIISIRKPDHYIYTLINFHFPTQKEIVIGKLDPKMWTSTPKSVIWIKGEYNFNYYNLELMG